MTGTKLALGIVAVPAAALTLDVSPTAILGTLASGGIGVIGWFLLRAIATNDRAQEDAAASINALSTSIGRLSERLALAEERVRALTDRVAQLERAQE